MLNTSKLVRWNLSQPLLKRIARTDLLDKTEYYKMRGNLMALYNQIQRETDAKTAIDDKWI